MSFAEFRDLYNEHLADRGKHPRSGMQIAIKGSASIKDFLKMLKSEFSEKYSIFSIEGENISISIDEAIAFAMIEKHQKDTALGIMDVHSFESRYQYNPVKNNELLQSYEESEKHLRLIASKAKDEVDKSKALVNLEQLKRDKEYALQEAKRQEHDKPNSVTLHYHTEKDDFS